MNWQHITHFNWCGCQSMRASWAMRELTNWLRRVQTLHLTRARTWPTVQHCQVRNRGLETHRVLEVWQRLMKGPQQGRATQLLNMSRQQLSVVIGLLTGHLGLSGHLYKIGKDINPLCRRCLSGSETVEHLLCECESLTMSRGRIFGQSFRELQQLPHVPVDLFRWSVTAIGLAGK